MGSKRGRQLVLGLVGQVCAGKSAVADAFRRRGADVFSADAAVHALYMRPAVIRQVRKLFGAKVLDSSGNVDRRTLGQVVFASPEKLKLLTAQVVFPRTREAVAAALKRFRNSNAPALVLDAPTLFEAGDEGLCDGIIFVKAPLKKRLAWAKARGWNVDEIQKRDAIMISASAKRRRVGVILNNSGTLKDLDQQVEKLFAALASGGRGRTGKKSSPPWGEGRKKKTGAEHAVR